MGAKKLFNEAKDTLKRSLRRRPRPKKSLLTAFEQHANPPPFSPPLQRPVRGESTEAVDNLATDEPVGVEVLRDGSDRRYTPEHRIETGEQDQLVNREQLPGNQSHLQDLRRDGAEGSGEHPIRDPRGPVSTTVLSHQSGGSTASSLGIRRRPGSTDASRPEEDRMDNTEWPGDNGNCPSRGPSRTSASNKRSESCVRASTLAVGVRGVGGNDHADGINLFLAEPTDYPEDSTDSRSQPPCPYDWNAIRRVSYHEEHLPALDSKHEATPRQMGKSHAMDQGNSNGCCPHMPSQRKKHDNDENDKDTNQTPTELHCGNGYSKEGPRISALAPSNQASKDCGLKSNNHYKDTNVLEGIEPWLGHTQDEGVEILCRLPHSQRATIQQYHWNCMPPELDRPHNPALPFRCPRLGISRSDSLHIDSRFGSIGDSFAHTLTRSVTSGSSAQSSADGEHLRRSSSMDNEFDSTEDRSSLLSTNTMEPRRCF